MNKKPKTEEQLFTLDVRYIAKCLRAMREALQDALNVFTEKGQLVTAERREAWERALKLTDGDPRPKLPPGWMWAEVSVPESDLGPDYYDGRALALMDAAKCKATMTAYEQANRMAQVCLDMHAALGIKWGDDPYARIRELTANAAGQGAAKPYTAPAGSALDLEGKR
jgi:hypothetical protein